MFYYCLLRFVFKPLLYCRYSKEPMFVRKPRSSEAREGDTVIIACEVIGDPKPDVYWLRDFLKVRLMTTEAIYSNLKILLNL